MSGTRTCDGNVLQPHELPLGLTVGLEDGRQGGVRHDVGAAEHKVRVPAVPGVLVEPDGELAVAMDCRVFHHEPEDLEAVDAALPAL